jgi:hypothetical protein
MDTKEDVPLSWKDDAVRMRLDEGKTWREIAIALQSNFPGKDLHQIQDAVRRDVRRSERWNEEKNEPNGPTNVQEALMKALTKGTTSADLADALGVSEKIAAAMILEKKEAGYNVLRRMAFGRSRTI